MKLKNYQPPNIQAPRDAPEGFPNKSFLGLLYSSKGTGKTNTLINIINEYDKKRFFQKIYLFSPTVKNDPKYQLLEDGNYQLFVYPNFSNETLKEVIDHITSDINEWKEYQRLKKLVEKAKKAKRPDLFEDEDVLDLFMLDWKDPEPPFDREPYSLIVFDDLASNKELMSQGKSLANSFMLLHRHKLTSVIYSVQQYRNAVPKMVRNNLDWWVLGGSKNEKDMESVAEELTSYASTKDIADMWARATAEPFNYFCVNLMVPEYRFTKNFDEPISPL